MLSLCISCHFFHISEPAFRYAWQHECIPQHVLHDIYWGFLHPPNVPTSLRCFPTIDRFNLFSCSLQNVSSPVVRSASSSRRFLLKAPCRSSKSCIFVNTEAMKVRSHSSSCSSRALMSWRLRWLRWRIQASHRFQKTTRIPKCRVLLTSVPDAAKWWFLRVKALKEERRGVFRKEPTSHSRTLSEQRRSSRKLNSCGAV